MYAFNNKYVNINAIYFETKQFNYRDELINPWLIYMFHMLITYSKLNVLNFDTIENYE